MIGLIQRVTHASVRINNAIIAEIQSGLLVLVAVEQTDSESNALRLAERLLGYRVFSDASGKMNLSVSDTGGGVLLVPQFTLAADTEKGMRPSFSRAAPPEKGSELFNRVVDIMRPQLEQVEVGQFGADMAVELVNDGPVTFWLKT